jgi:hypothetical protein
LYWESRRNGGISFLLQQHKLNIKKGTKEHDRKINRKPQRSSFVLLAFCIVADSPETVKTIRKFSPVFKTEIRWKHKYKSFNQQKHH